MMPSLRGTSGTCCRLFRLVEPFSISFFRFEGENYAFPSEGDTAWLWTRKDLLEEKGLKVPETWDDYLEVAKALTRQTRSTGDAMVWPIAVGLAIGMAMFGRVDAVKFRRMVYGLIFLSGVGLLLKGG